MKQLENKLNAASTLEDATNVLLKWYEGYDIVFFRTFVEKLPDFVLNTFLNAGYITDADSDNVIYGRKNGEWVDATGAGMDVDLYDPLGVKEQLVGTSAAQSLTNKTIIDLSNNIFANRLRSKALAYSTNIDKLQPVRIIGHDSGTDTNIGEIVNNSIYTAYGLAGESTTVGEPFEVVHQGLIENADTSIFNEGDILYVSSVGDLTSVIPTEGIVQPIAYVVRVDSVYGVLLVNGFYTVPTALQIPFNNSILGVDVFNVQEAIDYIALNGGGSGGATNLSYTASASNGIVTSDTGTDATIPLADFVDAGLISPEQFSKLIYIEESADVTDATNVSAAGAPIISSGAGVPISTPIKVGNIYIDTTNNDAYIAVGIASSADWEKTNDGAGGGISDGDKGDITVSNSGITWTIDNGAVTLAKQADMATASVVYRKTAGAGAPEVQTLATLKTDLGLSNTNSGDNAVNSLYSGLTQYTDEMAQDAVGAILDIGDFFYDDGAATIALHSDVTASLALADSAVQAASTATFTNKTFDANGTGNSISNIEVADLAAGVLDIDLSSVAGTDTTIPSAKATKAALDLKQDVLVSGTNIKTINSTSLLGTGNITVSASAAGTTTQVQFNNAGVLGANSLFSWDDTNKRLGVGVAVPLQKLHVVTALNAIALRVEDGTSNMSLGFRSSLFPEISTTGGYGIHFPTGIGFGDSNSRILAYDSGIGFGNHSAPINLWVKSGVNGTVGVGVSNASVLARLHVKGLGATSATRSFRVDNSSGVHLFSVRDDGNLFVGNASNKLYFGGLNGYEAYLGWDNEGVSGDVGLLLKTHGTNSRFVLLHNATYSFTINRITTGETARNGAAWFGWSATPPLVDLSAQVQIDSTTKGFLPPRMTTTQKNAIATPAAGLVVYDTTLNKLCVYTTAWETLTSV